MMNELIFIPKEEFDRLLQADLPMPDTLRLFADCCRANTLLAIKKAGSGHIGSSFSAMDIVVHLYLQRMNTLRTGIDSPDRDIYFSSKGHDAPGLYSVLYALGIITEKQLLHLRRLGGLDGHPDISIAGIEANTGSLGMGIGKARGMVVGKEIQEHKGHVYVLLGDGELQEGQIYESLLTTANQGKGRLTAIIDRNYYQSDKSTESISPLGDIPAKFKAFGWNVFEVDGHDHLAMDSVFEEVQQDQHIPTVILARTIKGKGVSFMESSSVVSQGDCIYAWHSGAPEDERYIAAHAELLQRCVDGFQDLGLGKLLTRSLVYDTAPSYPATADSVKTAYGERLLELAQEVPELVVLDADLATDCAVRNFEEEFAGRFVENGIAEQDMVSMAGGMALQGLLPVVNSFACFLASRANEQIYNNGTENTKVIYGLHLAGLIPAAPGKSHQSLRDIALFSALPHCEIVQPCNPAETKAMLDYFVKKATGVCAMRLFIGASPCQIDLPQEYTVSPGCGTVLKEGKDGLFLAYGPVLLHEALKAAELLEGKGLSIRVVNMPWLNQVNTDWLEKQFAGIDNVLLLEDHAPSGALYDCLLRESMKAHCTIPPVFLQRAVEGYPACGAIAEVLKHHALDSESVAEFAISQFK